MGRRGQSGNGGGGDVGVLLDTAVRGVVTAPEEGLDLALDTGASLLAASARLWPSGEPGGAGSRRHGGRPVLVHAAGARRTWCGWCGAT